MKLLHLLAQKIVENHAQWDWTAGRTMPRFANSTPVYTTYTKGYEIKISHHDHSRDSSYRHDKSRLRANMPIALRHWIEISVRDMQLRFGRGAIIRYGTIKPEESHFPSMLATIEEIKKRAKTLQPLAEDRLSVDNCILGMCKEL
jgi:hypothetical protein